MVVSRSPQLTYLPSKPYPMTSKDLTLRGQTFYWGQRTYLMAILNVTPDSFSDGGKFDTLDRAIAQASCLQAGGAHLLDIGGQSTRPRAEEVSVEVEMARVIPVIQALRRDSHFDSLPISVDTTRAAVAKAAIAAGGDLVNDVSGGTYDPDLLPLVGALGVPVVLMHLRGTPATMEHLTDYQDLQGEVKAFLARQAERAQGAGVAAERIILDPGLGFAKTPAQNLQLLRSLPHLRALGYPVLVGPSRKSFIGALLNQPDPQQRLWGTAAACCGAIAGGADILRVHDPQPMGEVCRVADALWRPQLGKC